MYKAIISQTTLITLEVHTIKYGLSERLKLFYGVGGRVRKNFVGLQISRKTTHRDNDFSLMHKIVVIKYLLPRVGSQKSD